MIHYTLYIQMYLKYTIKTNFPLYILLNELLKYIDFT